MNGEKTLFPLFTKANGPSETNKPRTIDQQPPEINGLDGKYDDEYQKSTKAPKARKPRKKKDASQKTLQEIVNPKVVANGTAEDDEEGGDGQTECRNQEPSPRRSKRRRTSRTNSVEVGGQDEEEASNDPPPERRSSPQVIVPASSPLPAEPVPAPSEQAKTPPKKMLRLKGGGKFSSPVSMKMNDEEPPVEGAKKRGRPRKVKVEEHEKHLVAVMKYDTQTEVGSRIDRILAGEERFKKQVKIVPKKQSSARKANGSAHPFFSLDRREEQVPAPVQPSPRKASAVTPGKLRRQTMNAEHLQPVNEPPEAWTSTLLKDRLMFKHPGAKEPAWPDKEQTHVRGLVQFETLSACDSGPILPRRKRKTARRSLPQTESLLGQFASSLQAEEHGVIRPDGFREAHPALGLPSRLLISGQEIAQKVATQLSVADPYADELSIASSSQPSTHPALRSTFDKISSNFTAFDEGKGETIAWAQKYAPTSCSEVLQPARQTTVLKDWLSSLKVTAVERATKADSRIPKKELKPKKRKRRPKDDDLDDFLVDSDEDIHNMDELTDPEDLPASSAQNRDQKILNSIVQVATDGMKLSNAVLLSGPHGCGKTAAAYAVSKELVFKVFEISSSERRSGKDVLDKVGDMTENHLVRHHGTDAGEQSSTEEPSARLDEAFERDLASGRQGKMASFFKPQSKPKPKPKVAASPKETVKAKAVEAVQNVLKKPPKDQQQSLILLEEVDVLFKEDKDFWTTVLKLIATSKRPFIMTCNDEDQVPLQAMSLHAILRFTLPPVDLATDYLLIIAAAEGHLLERSAVSSLYRSKDSDLRAAISELNLWCQMGVGDPRGGLSWIFQRFPPGSDLDAKGRRLRIVSEDTYQRAMGSFTECSTSAEDQLLWAWREHDLDASTALGWETIDETAAGMELEDHSKFASDLSAADVYARPLCSPRLDLTQKPMKDKARSHYVEGLPLFQTDEQMDYSGLSSELLTTSTLLAFEARNMLSSDEIHAKLKALATHDRSEQQPSTLTRHAFACFDPISAPVESALSAGPSGLQQSAFDGPLNPIATDIAPYVRSIVLFDLALAEQREALGGGKSAKRVRTTRAARSALEGGLRASTRREKWFPKSLDMEAVLGTGGRGWPRMLAVAAAGDGMSDEERECEGEGMPASSAESGV